MNRRANDRQIVRAYLVFKGLAASQSPGAPADAQESRSFAAHPSVREEVRAILESMQFSVLRVSGLSIAVEAPPNVFERVFVKKLNRRKVGQQDIWAWSESPVIPTELSDSIETVVFPQPVKAVS